MSPIVKFILSLVLCFAVAAIGGLATAKGVTTWYLTLEKPSFNPPSWLFGPVWTVLYIVMAIAFWKIWTLDPSHVQKNAMIWFGIQLGLNLLWSVLFFYLQVPGIALVEILLMWGAILMTIIKFGALVPWTGYILIPYLLWVSFASLLNAAIWWLN